VQVLHPALRSRPAKVVGMAVAATAGVTIAGSLAGATVFARKVLTPDARRPDDTVILAVDDDRVTLVLTEDTVVPGRYGLWLEEGAGHARVGDILGIDEGVGAVTRRLLGVDRGRIAPGPARWNQYYYWSAPQASMGLPTLDVHVDTELGPMPAWRLEPEQPTGTWAVLVHGRGARREECLRGLPTLLGLGMTCLVPSYRNDPGAARAPDGRYNLGLSEWRDIESAMLYAAQQGATSLVLCGWSMGGAIALQTLNLSWLSDLVEAVVLDSPVVDWGDVLTYHARANHVPPLLRDFGRLVMGRKSLRRLAGVHEPVDVARTNWVARAHEIHHRVLILHSVDDEVVPAGPSIALARARPDLVTLDRWDTARHCREWNLDTARWERSVRDFLSA